jgi:hypothetical protein
MLSLLSRLLREDPTPIAAPDVAAWWEASRARRPAGAAPIDQAILGGFAADRVGFAFAAGYEAALRALAAAALPEGAVASFCATEHGGNHPRAIQTRLTPRAGGGFTLQGAKRWSTMGPLASVLLVVASEGVDEAGRNRLRVAVVRAAAPGVTVSPMPPTPFVPEVPHAVIDLDGVEVAAAAILPGDGYTRYVKPFRTVEDLHIFGALLGYLMSAARRHGFPHDVKERIVAGLAATRALAGLDPGAAEVHVALAGLLAQEAQLREDLSDAWATVAGPERERWQRDRPLFGAVAGQVRERRRQAAWDRLAQASEPTVSRS